jgi:uncharacterized protein (TIGR02246 family)
LAADSPKFAIEINNSNINIMKVENKDLAALLPEDDAKAIYAVIKKLSDAWANGDGTKYAALFTEDAHYVEAPGNWVTGRKTIAERHQEIFDTLFKNTRIDGDYTTTFQLLTPDVVLVHATGTVLFPGESDKEEIPNGIITMALSKNNGIWQIASFQNTPTGKFRTFKFAWRIFRSKFRK